MLFFLRFCYTALLLIFTSLILPRFDPGGRYQILFIATVIALIAQIIRYFAGERVAYRHRGLLSGSSIIIGLLAARLLFEDIRLTISGVLLSYIGMSFLELLLPNQLAEVVYQKKDE